MDDEEALRRLGQKAALSHLSAARRWGIELLDDDGTHVTVPRSRSRVVLPGVVVHRADLSADEVLVLDGARLTTPLRTVVDLARSLAFTAAVVAADSALRLALVRAADLAAAAAELPRAPGSAAARGALRAVDAHSGSVLETLLRLLFAAYGLWPVTQFVVRDAAGGFVARVDFCWPEQRLIVEADGFAYHSDREAYRRDRDRLNELNRLGWRVVRFTWEDVVARPEHVVATVRSMLAAAA